MREEQPFQSNVNLEEPIRLIAIAPTFHRDTLTDCKYNALEFDLYTFIIVSKNNVLELQLTHNTSDETSSARLSQLPDPTKSSTGTEIPDPPRKLLNWLGYESAADSKAIIDARRQILSFDTRMKEANEPQSIRYGKGKSKPCAEIFQARSLSGNRKLPVLALWLPDPNGKNQVLRMLIDIDKTGKVVDRLTYCPRKNVSKDWWNLPEFNKFGVDYSVVPPHYKSWMDKSGKYPLSSLVDMALKTWPERI